MNLKTLLQSICFCDACNWKITRFDYSLCVYPLKYKTLNYVFNNFGKYIGSTNVTAYTETTIPKEHIEDIIKIGLSNYFDKHKV